MKKEIHQIGLKLNEVSSDIKKHLQSGFNCLICFEANPHSYYSCPFCGTYIGCFDCASKISRCPICKTEFKCQFFSADLPRTALEIPGFIDFLQKSTTHQNNDSSTQSGNDNNHGSDDGNELPILL